MSAETSTIRSSASLDWTNEHLLNLRRLDHPTEYVDSEYKRIVTLNPKLLDVPDDFDPFLDDPEPYLLMHDPEKSTVSGVYMRVAQVTYIQLTAMVKELEAHTNNQSKGGRKRGRDRARILAKFLAHLQARAIKYHRAGGGDRFFLTYVGVTQMKNVQLRIKNEDAISTTFLSPTNSQPFLSYLIHSCRVMEIPLKTLVICPQGSYAKEALAGMMFNVVAGQNTLNRALLGGSNNNRFMFCGRIDDETGFWTATGKLCARCNSHIKQDYQPLERFSLRPTRDPTLPECRLSSLCDKCLSRPVVKFVKRKLATVETCIEPVCETKKPRKAKQSDKIAVAPDVSRTVCDKLKQSQHMQWKLTYGINAEDTTPITTQIHKFAERFGSESRMRQYLQKKRHTVDSSNLPDPGDYSVERSHLEHVLWSVGFTSTRDEAIVIAAQQRERLQPGSAFRLAVVRGWEETESPYNGSWITWKVKKSWEVDDTGELRTGNTAASADDLFRALLEACRSFLKSQLGWTIDSGQLGRGSQWPRSRTHRIDRSYWDDIKAPLEQLPSEQTPLEQVPSEQASLEQVLSTRDTRNECNDVTVQDFMQYMSQYYRCDNEETSGSIAPTTTYISADADADSHASFSSFADSSSSSTSDDSVMSTERIVESQKITRN